MIIIKVNLVIAVQVTDKIFPNWLNPRKWPDLASVEELVTV